MYILKTFSPSQTLSPKPRRILVEEKSPKAKRLPGEDKSPKSGFPSTQSFMSAEVSPSKPGTTAGGEVKVTASGDHQALTDNKGRGCVFLDKMLLGTTCILFYSY